MRRMDGDVATATRLAPLPPRLPVNINGTANIAGGFRLHNARTAGPARPPKTKPLFGRDLAAELKERLDAETRDMQNMLRTRLEEKRQDKKKLMQRVRQSIELGLEAYEDDLEVRRDKLRELLLRDEARLTRELVESARKLEELRAAELAARAVEAEQERESERQALLREKRMQRFVEASHEIHEARRQAWTEDAKRTNLVQIAENEEKRRREEADEAYFHSLMMDRYNAETIAEAKLAAERANYERQVVKTLHDQMEANQRRRVEWSQRKPDKGYGPKESEEDKARRKAKNRQLRDYLEKQLAETKASLEKRRKEEEALDRMLGVSLKGVSARDANTPKDKEIRRREILAYMDNLKEFREAVARRETETDECLRRWAAEEDIRRRETLQRAKENRAKLSRELRHAWDLQLEEKSTRQQLEEKLQRDDCEREVLAYKAELKAERERRRQTAVKYGRELIDQHKFTETMRVCDRMEAEAYEKRLREKELEDRRLAQELVILGYGPRKSCTH